MTRNGEEVDPEDGSSGTWDSESISPYVHWRRALIGGAGKGVVEQSVRYSGLPGVSADVAPLFGCGDVVPVPEGVHNPNAGALSAMVPDGIGALVSVAPPRDAVITGIIDEAIALGHPRFRDASGRTRILASWQQGATFEPEQGAYLPFGHELYQADLNILLQRHSDRHDLTAALDDVGFNRAARLSEPTVPYGVRALDRMAGHGTAALDLAAGANAWQVDADDLARRPILAATLPRRYTIGMAGAFLEFFAIHAMHRIVALADAIWDAHYAEPGGYPIVLNVSYGQQAGAKDGTSLFEQAAERLMASRSARAPLQVVMPAGNDNLMRCNAVRKVRRGTTFRENWRIQPDDRSSNFVEIWTEASPLQSDRNPLDIKITTPDGVSSRWSGRHAEYQEISGGARIYCQRVQAGGSDDAPVSRYRYVVCTPPTVEDGLPVGTTRRAPAGMWQIQVQNRAQDMDVFMNIQVDQSAEPDKGLNRRSYFDNERYRTHLDNGRVRDSFAFPIDPDKPGAADQEDRRQFGHVQRKGTVNALALSSALVVVGAYRANDGAPAEYSATSYQGHISPGEPERITACFPGDDGAAHPGLLAAGTHGAAIVSARGTSFAAARATRWIVQQMLQDAESGSPEDLRRAARTSEETQARLYGAAHRLKIGNGRVASPNSDRPVSRL